MNQTFTSTAIVDYKKTILTLVSNLQRLREFSQKLQIKNELINDILQRIEVDAFSLAVVGEFNRGKSTFINALIGHDILPSDILATTATLSRITHKSTPGAKISFKDGREQEIAFHELTDYITKITSKSETTAAKLKEATIYYPVPFCQKNNVEIIDTPGLCDDANMTAVTLSVLRQCEMAIMLISPLSPFGISEGEFLTNKLLDNGIFRILFVVNGIDSLNSNEDTEKVINLIITRIETCIQQWAENQPNAEESRKRIGIIRVFGVSALQALQAKQANNMALLAQSCLVNFEYALKNIISRERGLIRLELTVNQIINSATEIIKSVEIQQNFLELEQANLRKYSQVIANELSTIHRTKIEATQSIDTIATSVKTQSHASYYRLENKLKAAVEEVIQSITANTDNQTELPNKVLDAVQKASRKVAKEIQTETQEALTIGWKKIREFAELFEQVIQRISPKMTQLGLDTTIYTRAMNIVRSVKKVCDSFNQQQPSTLSLSFPNNSEVFVFTEESNGAGTAIGAVLGFVLTAGTPIGAAIGGAIGAGVGANMKANKFKEKYQPQVMTEIEKQLGLMNVNQTVDNYISKAFSQLEELQTLFIKEVISILDTTQNQLAQICGQREATFVAKHRELNQIRLEVQKIMGNAQKLSEQLSQLSA
ncbi:dynamin family protein [Nostoc linckia]|jgi:GTPase Era involved in 16S rRNA processing|uniref:dynamin family protein n=1 Tax=Nostoc linckia TaxID=92942 RepID=UPI000BFFA18C|nr:dynamin family protein [Nostoc linckia]